MTKIEEIKINIFVKTVKKINRDKKTKLNKDNKGIHIDKKIEPDKIINMKNNGIEIEIIRINKDKKIEPDKESEKEKEIEIEIEIVRDKKRKIIDRISKNREREIKKGKYRNKKISKDKSIVIMINIMIGIEVRNKKTDTELSRDKKIKNIKK